MGTIGASSGNRQTGSMWRDHGILSDAPTQAPPSMHGSARLVKHSNRHGGNPVRFTDDSCTVFVGTRKYLATRKTHRTTHYHATELRRSTRSHRRRNSVQWAPALPPRLPRAKLQVVSRVKACCLMWLVFGSVARKRRAVPRCLSLNGCPLLSVVAWLRNPTPT